MKDLGDANHILCMRILRNWSKGLLFLSVLQGFAAFQYGGGDNYGSIASIWKLGAEDNPTSNDEKVEMAKIPYASAVGSLMYAMIATQLDIAFPV